MLLRRPCVFLRGVVALSRNASTTTPTTTAANSVAYNGAANKVDSGPKADDFSLDGPGDLYWPKSAQELIAEVPPIEVHGSVARCDGGGGALGHPAVFINLNKGVAPCGYCGLRFVSDDHH